MAKKRKQMSASEDDDETETSGECEHRRGRSTIAVVGKAIRRGAKLPLEWNHNKVPIGTNKEVFASYIGVVVRERVSINYREWEDVPKQVINEVYEFITKGFEVPEERRSYVLTRASIRWRTFKARLIKYWMYDTKGENKNVIIRNPPSMYPWILQSHWNEFIATYTDPKFKELSDLNRERAKKKSSSYRGGRKGYVYYEEQIAEELRSQKIEVKDVPRHLVWIRAHPRQENNEMYFDNPADFEVAQAIKALEVQQRKGEIDVVGRNDILARALKTPEHGGCVRGVGSGVTNKQYFGYNKPTPPSQVQSELRNVKTQLAHLENTQNLLMSYILSGEFNPEHLKQICSSNIDQVNNKEFGSIQRIESIGVETDHYDNVAQQGLQGVEFRLSNRLKGIKKGEFDGTKDLGGNMPQCEAGGDLCLSSSGRQEKEGPTEIYRVPWPETTNVAQEYMPDIAQVIEDQSFPKGVESLCSLAIEKDDWIDIVASGRVYVPKENEVVKHHFKPVPSGHYKVCITEEMKSDAPLPCPEGELRFICQGKDNFFIWPRHLVLPIKKNADKKYTKEFTTPSPHSQSSQASSTRKYTITLADKSKLTSSLIQVFKDVAIGMKKSGKTKSFNIPFTVFQNEHCVSFDYEDMLDWCFQREIGSSHLSIFMMYLSDMVHTEGISGLYGFCDCNILSPETPTVENEDDRSNYLSRVFACNNGKNKNQVFFAPYNEGRHWMLAVICPWIGLVHWLDPAGVENEPRDFAKKIINKAIVNFSVEHRKDISKVKKNPYIRWIKIECPRQPFGSKDCGYYVCRYMIETIESRQMFIPEKYFDKVPPSYSQAS